MPVPTHWDVVWPAVNARPLSLLVRLFKFNNLKSILVLLSFTWSYSRVSCITWGCSSLLNTWAVRVIVLIKYGNYSIIPFIDDFCTNLKKDGCMVQEPRYLRFWIVTTWDEVRYCDGTKFPGVQAGKFSTPTSSKPPEVSLKSILLGVAASTALEVWSLSRIWVIILRKPPSLLWSFTLIQFSTAYYFSVTDVLSRLLMTSFVNARSWALLITLPNIFFLCSFFLLALCRVFSLPDSTNGVLLLLFFCVLCHFKSHLTNLGRMGWEDCPRDVPLGTQIGWWDAPTMCKGGLIRNAQLQWNRLFLNASLTWPHTSSTSNMHGLWLPRTEQQLIQALDLHSKRCGAKGKEIWFLDPISNSCY